MVPNSISLPILTSTGREAKWYPRGVSFSSGVNAPKSCSRSFDARKDSVLGGSISRDKTEWRLCAENISRILILKEGEKIQKRKKEWKKKSSLVPYTGQKKQTFIKTKNPTENMLLRTCSLEEGL